MQSITNTHLPIKLTKRNSSRFKTHASVNWKYVEAVNGRAAMYGTILGGSNWGLTGLNVIEQTQYLPCAILATGSTLIAIGTMTNAIDKLSEEDFEKFASINTGRFFMTCFSGLVIAAITGV